MAMKMFSRHQIDSTAEEFGMMRRTNANIDQLLAEYGVRVSGENGIATSFLHLLTPMETWCVIILLFNLSLLYILIATLDQFLGTRN